MKVLKIFKLNCFRLVCCFLLVACGKNTETVITKAEVKPPVPVENLKGNYSYLALGDSYTIGQSVEAMQNFPNQLVAQLKNSDVNSSVKIVAQTGWTTTNLLNAIDNSSLNAKYDFVTLLIGVNNQYQRGDITTYKNEFIQLLKTSIKYAGGNASRVFVLSIPDYSVTPFAGNDTNVTAKIAREIDAYNQIGKEETAKLNANYLNITPFSREAQNNLSLLATDGLHPSGTMYNQWVQLLAPALLTSLK